MSYAERLIAAIAFGSVLGFAICYAVGHWWPLTEAEKRRID
jgi:membrane protein DedA with SNARE-associated domain